MSGRLVYEVATLISETASEKLTESMTEGDDPKISYRTSLLLALVASEAEKDTTKEELISYLSRFYDLVHKPSNVPPPPPERRTKSAEFRLQLKVN